MRKLLASVLVLSLLVVAAIAALCSGRPTFIVQTNPGTLPAPGSQVTFRVGLDEPASGNQPVAIYVDDPSLFSSLPSVVYVPHGQTSTTFQATLSLAATGGFTIVASANGDAVDCDVVISTDVNPKR